MTMSFDGIVTLVKKCSLFFLWYWQWWWKICTKGRIWGDFTNSHLYYLDRRMQCWENFILFDCFSTSLYQLCAVHQIIGLKVITNCIFKSVWWLWSKWTKRYNFDMSIVDDCHSSTKILKYWSKFFQNSKCQ